MENEDKKKNSKLQITLALIGLVGILGGALFSNIDKIGSALNGNDTQDPAVQGTQEPIANDSSVNVDFSGDNNDSNQVIVSDRIDTIENTTNVFEEKPALTSAPENIIELLLPGTPLDKAVEIFGSPNRSVDNTLIYNQLDNLYIRLISDDSRSICSSTFQLKGDSSTFTIYPVDIFGLGSTTFNDVFGHIDLSELSEKEAGSWARGGNYSSVTRNFGGAGRSFIYTFGISEYLGQAELAQLPHSDRRMDFVTITAENCPSSVKSGMRPDEYL